jgi:hypothetical protein
VTPWPRRERDESPGVAAAERLLEGVDRVDKAVADLRRVVERMMAERPDEHA